MRAADATVEALAAILNGLPKGVPHVRDKLAGWLLNLSRYSGGTDRPFWLESYVGGPYTVDRQKNPKPVFIPRLAVATFGTIQPDRLENALTGVDDGLAGQFLWTWPDPHPFLRPPCHAMPRRRRCACNAWRWSWSCCDGAPTITPRSRPASPRGPRRRRRG